MKGAAPTITKPAKVPLLYYLKRLFNFKAWNPKLLMVRLSALLPETMPGAYVPSPILVLKKVPEPTSQPTLLVI
jgi:hypothetical protein